MHPKSPHIRPEPGLVSRAERIARRGHPGATLWFTGLSGSGKSTLAHAIERRLIERGCVAYVLDGDNLRHGLNRDLGFAPEDRRENIRRVSEVARLFTDAGVLVLCAFVSPYREDRDRIRAAMSPGDFVEIYVHASVETCQRRDPKGLYDKAAAGAIADLTGVGAPYEPPLSPELVLDTETTGTDDNVARTLAFLERARYAPIAT